jgi:FMN-dependent NADH-azoreductase
MTQILHIDSSPRGDRSVSRMLSREFVEAWKATHAGDTVMYRDLGHDPVPHVDENLIAAMFSSPDALTSEQAVALAASDELVDEFLAADRLVFGVPMYNLNIPSTLKAYIDQIVRVGRTFAATDQGYAGLVYGKKMLVITSRGGAYQAGTPAADYDLQEPYIRAIFGFMGVTDITFIHTEGLNFEDAAREQGLTTARSGIEQAVAAW